ncbi:hypothetical protein SALINJAH_117 [Bacillus phage SalinJah]|uniref:Uncharacterized protein n=1 Tax=Bacillus phage SalinJah TaxID=1837830 RepID=A0A173GBH7_9CAUD|nr:hypothetical protein SALINJAH_117 [Bacillus phage SalinJah]ANH50553.1 hypothetical protein SALINJAH_117 [Bacillus phage SalinJah]
MVKIDYLINPTDEEMDEWNRHTARIFDRAYMTGIAMAGEHSKEAATMFDDWWHGGLVFNDEYKSCIPEECYEHGHSIIAHVTSQGFG